MMPDLLTPLIANGTIAGDFGYAPWLPFPEFLPIIISTSIIFYYFMREQVVSTMFFVSQFTALIPTALMYDAWGLNPFMVFCVWLINVAIIMGSQLILFYRFADWYVNKIRDNGRSRE